MVCVAPEFPSWQQLLIKDAGLGQLARHLVPHLQVQCAVPDVMEVA